MILYFLCQFLGFSQIPATLWAKSLFAVADVSYLAGLTSCVYIWVLHRKHLQQPHLMYSKAKEYSEQGRSVKSKSLFLRSGAYKEASVEAERLGQRSEALRLAEMSGDLQLQSELYLKNKQFDRAAPLLENLAKFEDAASAYEKIGNYSKAIQLYERAQSFSKLKRLLKDLRQWGPLAEILLDQYEAISSKAALNAQDAEKARVLGYEAAQAFQAAGNFKEAAHVYVRLQSLALAGECFEKDGQLIVASDVYRQAGLLERSADLLTRAKKFNQAAEVYEEMNRPTDWAKSLEAAGHKTQARFVEAHAALDRQDPHAAASLFMKARKYDQAALGFESLTLWKDAAQAWLLAEQPEKAGVSFERAGLLKESAECFEKIAQFQRAAKIYEVGKYTQLASLAYQKAGDYYRAGQMFENSDVDAAIAIYQRAPHGVQDAWKIQHSLARLFLSKGYKELSEKILSDLVKTIPYSQETLKVFYDFARFLEMNGQYGEAKDVYDKILAVQFDYKDVLSRCKKLKTKLNIS